MNERHEKKIAFVNAVKQAKAYRTELLIKLSGLITIDKENKANELLVEHRTIRELDEQCQLLEKLITYLL